MNIDKITSLIQSMATGSQKTDNKEVNEGFSSLMISEMLKSSDIFKEDGDLSYPSMFRWQMAQHLSEALSEKVQIVGSNFGDISNNLKKVASAIARKEGVDENLIKAVIDVESAWDKSAVSHAGAKGLMQLIDATADRFGVKDVFNPSENIRGGVKFLKHLLGKYDDINTALAAYNAGEGAVAKYNGIPPYKETKDYVKKVMNRLNHYNRIENVKKII